MKKLILVTVLLSLTCQGVLAIHQGATEDGRYLPYEQKMSHPLDDPINKALEDKAFYMNLGPTGIRAEIRPEHPLAFKVKYVFKDPHSPAKGLINVGDMIVGVNGKEFKNPHGFHRKKAGADGWQGPPFELALAIEAAQGKDGKLNLSILPDGRKSFKKNVTLQLKPVGKFASTWPWNCPRSDKLLKDLCDFVFDDGIPKGRPTTIQCILALWAADDKRAIEHVKKQAEGMMRSRRTPAEGAMVSWMWGYIGIFLGEYYNAFKDNGVKDAVEALNDCFERGMDYRSGGFSHRPFPAIQRRIADGGSKGYGAMAGPGGLAMLAMSTFKQTGLPYSEEAYNRVHRAYLGSAGASESGSIAYGFGGGWSHALIRIKAGVAQTKAKDGVGYRCPNGMKYVKDFEVEKWYQGSDGWEKKLVAPTGEFSWLKSEADELLVYESGHYLDSPPVNRPESKGAGAHQRMVIRPNWLPEPTSAYSNNQRGGGHNAPVGMGALAHFIGNKDNKSWNWLGKHMATCCAYSPKKVWDGHACAEMHAFFNILGASRADEKDFRHFLDYYKTLIVLSETHEPRSKGGMVEQPFGIQRNATCSIARNRKIYTYNTILLLSIPKRKLLITGADYDQPAPATTARAHSYSSSSSSSGSTAAPARPVRVVPKLRDARKLSDKSQKTLSNSLLKTLVKLSDAGMLKPMPIKISRTSALVALMKASGDGTLTFAPVAKTIDRNGKVAYMPASATRTAKFNWNDLASADRASLAMLVAKLKPDSTDAQALVGVYLEGFGRVREADAYFKKAGEASTKKLSKLFD